VTQSERDKHQQDGSGAADEQIEDLEAPADQQEALAGGRVCLPTDVDPGCGETR
jgi:hypothetical protein